MEGAAPREPLRGAAATERGFSAPSWDPFVAGTLAVLELGKVILMGCDTEAGAHSLRCSKTLFFSALDSACKFSQTLRSSPTWHPDPDLLKVCASSWSRAPLVL